MEILTKVLYTNTALITLLFLYLLVIPFKKNAYKKPMPTNDHEVICKIIRILFIIECILFSTKLAQLALL